MYSSARRRYTSLHLILAALGVTATLARPATAQSQSPAAEAAVQAARAAFAVTTRELPQYRRVERKSDEAGDVAIVGFYRGSELRKIEITRGDGENTVREECYFDGGQLLFRYREATVKRGAAAGAASRREDRYYFARNKLVRWVGSDGQSVPQTYLSFPVAERETLDGLKPVLAALASARPTFDPLDPASALLHTDWARALEVKAAKFDNQTLAHVLLYGERVDIKSSDKQPLSVSLWRAAVETSCGRAGHMICGYRYYLAVADPGEGGEMAVYDLGEFGTIEKAEWQPTTDDRQTLQIVALNYPAHVFERWTGVDRERGTFLLNIGMDSVAVRRSRPPR